MNASMTTYRRADGGLIAGEYEMVNERDWAPGDDEPTEYIEETWQLVLSHVVTIPERTCPECGGRRYHRADCETGAMAHWGDIVTPIAELEDTRAELARAIAELDEAVRQGFGMATS